MGSSLRSATLSHTITGVLLMQAQFTERTRLLCALLEPPILGLLRTKRLEDYVGPQRPLTTPISSLCNDGGKTCETLNLFPDLPSERVNCRPNGEAAIGKETQRYSDVKRSPAF